MIEEQEELQYEKKDFFNQFMRDVEKSLKSTGASYVFSEEQLKYIKSKYPINVVNRDECCIYIELQKGL